MMKLMNPDRFLTKNPNQWQLSTLRNPPKHHLTNKVQTSMKLEMFQRFQAWVKVTHLEFTESTIEDKQPIKKINIQQVDILSQISLARNLLVPLNINSNSYPNKVNRIMKKRNSNQIAMEVIQIQVSVHTAVIKL